MIVADRYAAASGLRGIDPVLKLWFVLPLLFLCLLTDCAVFSSVVLLAVGVVTVTAGKVPVRVFAGMMLFPLAFLLAGVAGVALDFGHDPEQFLTSLRIFGGYAGVTGVGLQKAIHLFFKAMGSVSCMYFIALTTPFDMLLHAAERLRVPFLVVEMAGLLYRFLFILLDTARAMRLAQESRLGYGTVSASFRSLSALFSTLFLHAIKHSEASFNALECRGYGGVIRVLREPYTAPRSFYLLMGVVYGLLSVVLWYCVIYLKSWSW